MPHSIIECSENVIEQKPPDEIMQAVHEAAEATGLFATNDRYFDGETQTKDVLKQNGTIQLITVE